MESDNTFSTATKSPHIGAGEKQFQHAKNTNDASKGWPPPKSRVQRSSSIRFLYLDYKIILFVM